MGTIIGRVSLTVVFGMGTCVSSRVKSPENSRRSSEGPTAEKAAMSMSVAASPASRHSTSDIRIPRNAFQEAKIKVVKHSPVSTGQLRLLPALHIRPINLVVYQGASGPKSNET